MRDILSDLDALLNKFAYIESDFNMSMVTLDDVKRNGHEPKQLTEEKL